MTSSLNFLSGGNGNLLKKLMGFVQNPSEENNINNSEQDRTASEKTVKSIIKKFKKSPGALENLERAITNRDSTTECFTMSR